MTDIAALEARLRELEDRDAIRQIQIDYGNAIDRAEVDRFAALFADDGEIKLGPLARGKGPAEIREAVKYLMSTDGTVHLISNPEISVDGDTATACANWSVVAPDADGKPVITMTGYHKDDLVRTPDGWRIKLRRGFMNIPAVVLPGGRPAPS